MAKKAQNRPDEETRIGDYVLRRIGNSVQFSVNRTAEEFAAYKRQLWESRPKIIQTIRTSVNELVGIIQKYSSFDLVANLWLRNGIFNPETYREWDAPQRPHFIEYAALLELKSEEYRLTPEMAVKGPDVSRAQELIEEIFRDTMWYHMARASDPENKPEDEVLRKASFFGTYRNMAVGHRLTINTGVTS